MTIEKELVAQPLQVREGVVETLEELCLVDLVIDHERQRRLAPTKVRAIVKDFDEKAVNVLVVSRRADGVLAVVDGQHRRAALLEKAYATWDCHVFTGLTLGEEASLFEKYNYDRSIPEPIDRFRIKLSAGDPAACEIKRIAEDCGCFIYTEKVATFSKTGGIYAVASLEKMYRVGGEELIRTVLRIVTTLWPHEVKATDALMLNGFARFVSAYKDEPLYSEEELLRKLKLIPRVMLVQKCREYQAATFGGDLATAVMLAICSFYNKGKTQAKWLPDRTLSTRSTK